MTFFCCKKPNSLFYHQIWVIQRYILLYFHLSVIYVCTWQISIREAHDQKRCFKCWRIKTCVSRNSMYIMCEWNIKNAIGWDLAFTAKFRVLFERLNEKHYRKTFTLRWKIFFLILRREKKRTEQSYYLTSKNSR